MNKKIYYPLILSAIFLIGWFSISIIKDNPYSTDDPQILYLNEDSPDNNTGASNPKAKDITFDEEEDTNSNTSNLAPLSESQSIELDNNVTSVLDSIDDALNSLDNVDELNLDNIN